MSGTGVGPRSVIMVALEGAGTTGIRPEALLMPLVIEVVSCIVSTVRSWSHGHESS